MYLFYQHQYQRAFEIWGKFISFGTPAILAGAIIKPIKLIGSVKLQE